MTTSKADLQQKIRENPNRYPSAHVLLNLPHSVIDLRGAMSRDIMGVSHSQQAYQKALEDKKKAQRQKELEKQQKETEKYLKEYKEQPKSPTVVKAVIKTEKQEPFNHELKELLLSVKDESNTRMSCCRAIQRTIKSYPYDNLDIHRLVYSLTDRY